MSGMVEHGWTYVVVTSPGNVFKYRGVAWRIIPSRTSPSTIPIHTCTHRHALRRHAERCGHKLMLSLRDMYLEYAKNRVAAIVSGDANDQRLREQAMQLWYCLVWAFHEVSVIHREKLMLQIQSWYQSGEDFKPIIEGFPPDAS